jgi:endonuclease/exonuclease/phosphatase family metal-dependent hydrolase
MIVRKILRKIPLSSWVITIFLSLFILFNLTSCQKPVSTDPSQAKSRDFEANVMTFNLPLGGMRGNAQNSWNNRRQIVLDILGNHQIDVLGMQEVQRTQLDEIRQALPKYGEVGVARDDGQTRGEYTAILYNKDRFMMYEDESGNFWLSQTPEIPGSRSWNTAYIRICTWVRLIEKETGNAFYVFNTHLDNVSQLAREQGILLIYDQIMARKNNDPFILMADFNTSEKETVIQYIKGQASLGKEGQQPTPNPMPLEDTFRKLHPDANDILTRHDWTGNRQGDKIDFIFTSPGIKVLDAQIIYDNVNGQYPSDHYPVMARINILSTRK